MTAQPEPAAVGRRAAVALGTLGALAGCAADGSSTAARTSTSSSTDEGVVAGAAQALLEAIAVLETVRGARATQLRAVLRDHRSHLARLDPEGSVAAGLAAASPSTTTGRTSLAEVRRSEQRLQRRLLGGCVAATSGPLALLLASVAASTAQHLAALPDSGTDDRTDGEDAS